MKGKIMCYAADCNHNFENSDCKLFRFPTDILERKKWARAVRRLDRPPSESDRLCSCHFADGKRENGPTIFSWNSKNMPALPKKQKRMKSKNSSKKTKSDHKAKKNISGNEVVPVHDNDALRTEVDDLRKEIEKLKKQPFGFHCVENDEKLLSYYTGLTSDAFNMVLDSCSRSDRRYFLGWEVKDFNLQNQLLITLMKLRLNLDYFDLAVRFNTSEDIINNVVLTFINLLHEIWFVGKMKEIFSGESVKADRMIVGFAEFDTIIPDQVDEIEKPSKKHKNTLKGMITIDSGGVITYCSQLYPEFTQDKVILRRSGITKKFQAVKLTVIDGDPASDNVSLNVDSKVHAQTIKRLRCFGILNFIPKPLFTHSSKVFQVCGALANLINPQSKLFDQSDVCDAKEEKLDDCSNFICCIKTEFEEEVTLEMESMVHANAFDAVSCKSEPESESEVEFITEEIDVELEEEI